MPDSRLINEEPLRPVSPAARALAAIGAPLAALLVSLLLDMGHGETPFLIFYPAVAIAAWYGGVTSGVVASVLSVALADWFLIEPAHSFIIPTGRDTLVAGVFLASAFAISRMSGAHREARATAERLAGELSERALALEAELVAGQTVTEELEATNQELAATNEELEAANEYEAQRGHLFSLAASLARASTPDEVASVMFREALAAVGADAGSIGMVSDDGTGERTVTLLHSAGYSDAAASAYQHFPLTTGRPFSDAIIAGTPVLIGTEREWKERYPETFPAIAGLGYEAFAVVPVAIGGRTVAAISFSYPGPRTFSTTTVEFLETLASVSGQALERSRAFEAERRERDRANVIVESITDGFVAFDADFRFSYVNRRAAELWKRAPSELIGRTPFEVFSEVPGIEQSVTMTMYARVLATRKSETNEAYSPTLRRWIESRSYPAADGGIVAFFSDITARRRAQDASSFLAEASRLLGSSINYADTLTNLARAAVPRLGDWCAVDVLRDASSTLWPPALDRVAVVHEDPEKIALGAQLTEEYPTDWSQETGMPSVLRNGTSFFLPGITDEMLVAGAKDARHLGFLRALQFSSIMIVPLIARGRVLGTVTLCMTESGRTYDDADLSLAEDLARRAGTAVDTARLLRDADLANAAKTEFLRTISHELRQPINATVSFLELWEMGLRGTLSTELREDLARMQRNQRHLLALIEDLFSFTRIDAGKLTILREPVLMRDVLASLDAIMSAEMATRQVGFEVVPCGEDLQLPGDQARLVQIGVNLLTNAMRATAEGGRVRVECDSDGEAVSLIVSDTGVGIPPDRLEDIFSPFTQIGRSLNAPKEGAGLGLAISRGLAEAMGGSLTATSAVGVGSTFVLRLPNG